MRADARAKGWRSAANLISDELQEEIGTWGPEQDAVQALMWSREQGGGLPAPSAELARVRAALVAAGLRALAWEERLGR